MTSNITIKTIFKYSFWAGMVIVFFAFINIFFIDMKPENFDTAEVVGYTSMVLSMLLIFLALNEFRQQQPNQQVSFKKAMQIGLAISAIAGVLFGIYNWVYVSFVNPEFMDQYFNYYIENIRNSGDSQAQIDAHIQQLEAEKAMFQSPIIQFITMFMTEFLIGLVISLIAALIESKRKVNHQSVPQ